MFQAKKQKDFHMKHFEKLSEMGTFCKVSFVKITTLVEFDLIQHQINSFAWSSDVSFVFASSSFTCYDKQIECWTRSDSTSV